MHTSPAGSWYLLAQSWHSLRVSFVLLWLLLAVKHLTLWCWDFFRVLFFFLLPISIHSAPCFNYQRSNSSSISSSCSSVS